MPRQITDRYTSWSLDRDHLTWTLAEGVIIDHANGTFGIYNNAAGSKIRVLGDVIAYQYGVDMGSEHASLFVGEQATVSAETAGVFIDAAGGTVVSHGLVQGGDYGIFGLTGVIENFGTIAGRDAIGISVGAFEIRNHGYVTGVETAIEAEGQGKIFNGSNGIVSSGEYGMYLEDNPGTFIIVNQGIISSDVAIFSEGQLNLKNTGTIIGDIMLSDGADRIDTRGGTVRGEVYGGGGDDTYLISSARVKIIDNGASFADMVRSTASYTLTGGLDHLTLLGGKDINGSSSAGDNFLTGNAGDNRLDGGVGHDTLSGGAGNDRLVGGAGLDTFVFGRGFDVDRIEDYDDGTDAISSENVRAQQQFDRLDIRQAGDNTVIDFGKGDRLILERVDASTIDFGDFQLP